MFISVSTKKSVSIGTAYTTKDDVALYILTYHQLPKNYYVKSSSDSRDYSKYGYTVLGGFVHAPDENLPDELENANLSECDIVFTDYTTSNRGTRRLVYTTNTKNVRVFYTANHYTTYTEITKFSINVASYITAILAWSLFGIYAICMVVSIVKNSPKELPAPQEE